MSLQDEFRQALPSEEELIATDVRIANEGEIGAVPQKCPTKTQWMLFVAGRLNEPRAEAFAEHLAECESCTAVLAEIRSRQEITERRGRNKIVFAAIAAVVLIAALLATWLIRGRSPSETVIADLRNVTRGVDTSPDSGVTLHRNTRYLRILLAPRPVEGHYEIGMFSLRDQTSPILSTAASATRESDSLVLEASLDVRNIGPGPYLLGIRHNQSEWAYYSIRID